MKKKNLLVLLFALLAVLAGLFFLCGSLKAYEVNYAHPFLTTQITELYNQIYTPKLEEAQIQKMIEGSIAEDTDPRWINHFYDPATGEGWLGKNLGDLPAGEVMQAANLFLGKDPVSTLNWMHNQDLQEQEYSLYQGNRAFENALLFYTEGNTDEAYLSLGHILHDVEDMAVPAHTRQDSHFDMPVPEIIQRQLGINLDKGEPYEKWAGEYAANSPADIAESLKDNYKPICSSLDDCLNVLSQYSNNNFFSSDTILDEEYNFPKVEKYIVEGNFINAYGKNNLLLFNISREDEEKSINNKAYWDKLAPEAVLAGVETVRYFYEEAEKVKNGEVVINRPDEAGFFAELKNFSPYGQLALMYKTGRDSVIDFRNQLNNFGKDFASRLADTWDGFGVNQFVSSILAGFNQGKQQNDDIAENNLQYNGEATIQDSQDSNTNTGSLQEGYVGTGGPDPALAAAAERQEILDDIAEQLDIIKQQLLDMQKQQQNQSTGNQNNGQNTAGGGGNNGGSGNSSGGGGGAGGAGGGENNPVVYQSILISEVQIRGLSDDKEEFVELYNPNNTEVDLTDWYLQKKTKTGSDWATFASSALFAGKKIPVKGYFIIARTDYFAGIADVFTDSALSEDNSLVLKNPNREIVDKLGWGAAQDCEILPALNHPAGKTIGRKVLADSSEQDTENNSVDFEIQTATPKAVNIAYIEPPDGGGGDDGDDEDEPEPETPEKVLINEVQISGLSDEKEEFVELYNPGSEEIDLTDWYLQKKTKTGESWASFASSALFEGKKIKPKAYFLISREASSFAETSDITTVHALTADNTLAIKNSKGDIIDKLGWGAAQDYETAPAESPEPGKSIQRKWDLTNAVFQDTDDNSADFEKQESSPKASGPKISITDNTNYSTCMGSSSPGTYYYFIKIGWQAKSSANIFDVQYKLNDGEWKDWFLQTDKTEETFKTPYSLFNDNVYTFRARAEDSEGNISDWAETVIDLANPVVINEIAFWGTNASRDDEWIELYNRSGSTVDLTGWRISSGNNSFALSGEIPAKSYFLLEKIDDSAISSIAANQIFTVPLQKYSIDLYARNGRRTDWMYGSWNEGEFLKDGNYHSFERISAYAFGVDTKNWMANNSQTMNGADRQANPIYGTPGGQNSINQLYTSYFLGFEDDTVLTKELSPYLFWGKSYVFEGTTLTIEPGVVLEFRDNHSGIMVDGTLKAAGTAEEPIIFRPYYYREPWIAPGNWLGLQFGKTSTNSELENVDISYAGTESGWDFNAAIKAEQSGISVKDSVIRKSRNAAMWLIDSDSTVENVQFLENNTPVERGEAKAIFVEGGNPEIKNCYFKDNEYGIYITFWHDTAGGQKVPADPSVENNNFEENYYPIWFGNYSQPYFAGNQLANNETTSIIFGTGTIERDVVLKPDLAPYLVKTILQVDEGITLTLEPGTIVEFRDSHSGLRVNGTLKAIGSSDSPIIFRPYYYREPWIAPGNWLGLQFGKTSKNSEVENVDISYAGATYGENFGAAVRADQSAISVKNSFVHKNDNAGVWLINSASVIDGVNFLDHRFKDTTKALYGQGAGYEVKNSHFESQTCAIYLDKWQDPDTGEYVMPSANLHNTDPEDPEKNTFMDTDMPGGDIFDASVP